LECFRTGVGLNFDDTGIEHCQMHRHAVGSLADQPRPLLYQTSLCAQQTASRF
jgi:hypothetical protein